MTLFLSNKKGVDNLRTHIEKIVIPVFCFAIEKTDDDKRGKLNKVSFISILRNKYLMKIYFSY